MVEEDVMQTYMTKGERGAIVMDSGTVMVEQSLVTINDNKNNDVSS